jgi:hypothetical protein
MSNKFVIVIQFLSLCCHRLCAAGKDYNYGIIVIIVTTIAI